MRVAGTSCSIVTVVSLQAREVEELMRAQLSADSSFAWLNLAGVQRVHSDHRPVSDPGPGLSTATSNATVAERGPLSADLPNRLHRADQQQQQPIGPRSARAHSAIIPGTVSAADDVGHAATASDRGEHNPRMTSAAPRPSLPGPVGPPLELNADAPTALVSSTERRQQSLQETGGERAENPSIPIASFHRKRVCSLILDSNHLILTTIIQLIFPINVVIN